MYKEITIERLSVKSIFKLVALGLLFSFVPFFVLMGCFALFDANTLTHRRTLHGCFCRFRFHIVRWDIHVYWSMDMFKIQVPYRECQAKH